MDPARRPHPATEGVRVRAVRKPFRGAVSRQLRLWHWVSSALCLGGLLFFTVTGITLNHASDIEAAPSIEEKRLTVPPGHLDALRAAASAKAATLPEPLAEWLEGQLGAAVAGKTIEWSPGEAYIALPRPGGDAWVAIGTRLGEVTFESASRGPVSYLNDLHKGRNTGPAWRFVIDGFAVACLVFAVTGLLLLHLHAATRPSTWPLVGIGVLLSSLLAVLFIH